MHITARTGSGLARTAAAATLVALGTLLPSSAALAAPAEQLQEHHVNFACDVLSGAGANAYFSPSFNSTFGSEARLELWLLPDDIIVDPPTVVSGAADFTVGPGDSSLDGSFDLIDVDGGELVGTGTLEAALTPNGDVTYAEWPKLLSNTKHRETHVIQPMSVAGTLTLSIGGETIVMPLDACSGAAADFTAFFNHPASYIEWVDTREVSCLLVGRDMTVFMSAFEEYGLTASEIVVMTPTRSYATLDDGTATSLSRHEFSTALELFPGGAGLAAESATVTASATFEPLPKISFVDELEGATVRVVEQPYSISGSLTVQLEDGTVETFVMDDAACHGGDFDARLIAKPAN